MTKLIKILLTKFQMKLNKKYYLQNIKARNYLQELKTED